MLFYFFKKIRHLFFVYPPLSLTITHINVCGRPTFQRKQSFVVRLWNSIKLKTWLNHVMSNKCKEWKG